MGDNMSPVDALSVNFWVLRLAGAWVAGINSPILRLIYNVYGTVIISVMTLAYLSTEIIYVTVIWGDLEAMSEIILLLLTHVATTAKVLNLLIRRRRIEKLVEDSRQEIFLPRNIKHLKFLQSTIRASNRNNIFYVILCTCTVMAWAIVPLVDNSEDSPIFEVIYAYQIIGVTMNASVNGMMDTLVSILMALAATQVDMLRYDISNLTRSEESFALDSAVGNENVDPESNVVSVQELRRENKVKRKLREDGAVAVARKFSPGSMQQEKQDDILHERIVGCIEHHDAIIRFTREIQDTFGIGILIHFTASSAVLCLTCFELTLISPTSLRFYSMILYQGCMLLELYVYCWYGNGLIVKTSDLMTTAFHSQWVSCSQRFKNSLRLMMCRMQRPIQLTVGGLFGLSLETFSMILRTAYSFYAVIQRAHNKGW